MSDEIEQGALKVIELVGVSPRGFEDAVHQAIKRAGSSLEGIRGVEIERFSAKIEGNSIIEFHANVKLAFVVR